MLKTDNFNMHIFLKLMIVYTFIYGGGQAQETDFLESNLSPKIYKLYANDLSKKEVLSLFGEPALIEGSTLYYELDNFKYSLMLKFENQKLLEYQYVLPLESKITYFHLKNKIKKEALEAIEKDQYSPFAEYESINRHIRFKFKKNSKKKLYQISFKKESK